jgi:hypothetical protein
MRKRRRNFEHASSEANAEFSDSSNIFVYSLKSEGEWRDLIYHGALNNPGVALWVRNCSEVCCSLLHRLAVHESFIFR